MALAHSQMPQCGCPITRIESVAIEGSPFPLAHSRSVSPPVFPISSLQNREIKITGIHEIEGGIRATGTRLLWLALSGSMISLDLDWFPGECGPIVSSLMPLTSDWADSTGNCISAVSRFVWLCGSIDANVVFFLQTLCGLYSYQLLKSSAMVGFRQCQKVDLVDGKQAWRSSGNLGSGNSFLIVLDSGIGENSLSLFCFANVVSEMNLSGTVPHFKDGEARKQDLMSDGVFPDRHSGISALIFREILGRAGGCRAGSGPESESHCSLDSTDWTLALRSGCESTG
jgi:hypothetical protein